MTWFVFFASGAVIVYAGTKLSQYGDRIAQQTGLGGLWIGVVLMAAATSLPEVLTTVSASLLNVPDLAVGDLLGAGLTNMLTLGIIDLFHRQKRVWRQTALEQTLVAGLALALTAVAGLLVLLRPPMNLWGVGAGPLLIAITYVLGMRVVYRQEDMRRREQERRRMIAAEGDERKAPSGSCALRRNALGFAVATLALVGAAPLLATSAQDIAIMTGLGTTFVGTSLVAVTTSLPELVTAFAAVRLGAFDLAVGNLFGSNAFNMAALVFADAAYRPGPLLSAVSTAHAVTAFVSILLMSLGMMGIIYRAEQRFLLIEPDSLLMIVGYAMGMLLIFRVAV